MSEEDGFFDHQLQLLELEHEEELKQYDALLTSSPAKTLEAMGVALFQMRLVEQCSGMYGRRILTLGKMHAGPLGSHTFKTGDIVGILFNFNGAHHVSMPQLFLQAGALNEGGSGGNSGKAGVSYSSMSGTIIKISNSSFIVACDWKGGSSGKGNPGPGSCSSHGETGTPNNINLSATSQVAIIKVPSDVSYRRVKKAVKLASMAVDERGVDGGGGGYGGRRGGGGSSRSAVLSQSMLNVLFRSEAYQRKLSKSSTEIDDVIWFNNNLNPTQRLAVVNCLQLPYLAIIHGPPGTGKTTTVVEIILQEVKRGNKILVCAPSNIAVDNIVEQLAKFVAKSKCSIVRLGHPARSSDVARSFTLDSKILSSDYSQVIQELRKEIHSATVNVSSLKKDLKAYEEKCITEVLSSASVVLSTCNSAHVDGALRLLAGSGGGRDLFDLCIIDESGQAVEAECWIPILQTKKLILAGDHMQLPPTVTSKEAAARGLARTLLERQVQLHPDLVNLLSIQYRMNDVIMQWSSKEFYDGKLTAGSEEISSQLLADLAGVSPAEELGSALMLIDTCDCNMFELETQNEESKGNEAEADLAAYHVRYLVKSGVKPSGIAVISPYNLQIELIRCRVANTYPEVEIKSVDGFQGREKEAVVLSLVRSNQQMEIGFLAESRRLNVAITRAKRHVCVIADSHTVSVNDCLKGLMDYIEENGVVFTAADYLDKEDMEWTHLYQPKLTATSKAKDEKPTKSVKTEVAYSEQDLTARLESFMDDSNRKMLEFPKNLPGAGRAFVHEYAEKRRLVHRSVGKGANRRIIVEKPSDTPKAKFGEVEEDDEESESLSESVDSEGRLNIGNSDLLSESEEICHDNLLNENENLYFDKDDESSLEKEKEKLKSNDQVTSEVQGFSLIQEKSLLCTFCSRQVPQRNFDLHVSHCAKNFWSKSQSSKPAEKPKPTNFKSKKKELIKELQEDDFDSLCDAFQQLNKVCNEEKCKQSILSVSFNCNYCGSLFCSTHRCPESHGCDRNSVKRQARAQMKEPSSQHRGKQATPALKGKMKSKLSDMQKARRTGNQGARK